MNAENANIQDIFYTLPDTGDAKDCKKAMDALNAYLDRKVDTTYPRHCFRQLTQAPAETIRQFPTRLRRAAKDCGYGADTDNQIFASVPVRTSSENSSKKVKVLT